MPFTICASDEFTSMLDNTSRETIVKMAQTTVNMISPLVNNNIILLLIVMALAVIIGRWRARKSYRSLIWQKPQTPTEKALKNSRQTLGPANMTVTPLENFEWSNTEPLALRTFKPQYHITMGTSGFVILIRLPEVAILWASCSLNLLIFTFSQALRDCR